jgi:hypothetical protein
MNVHDEWDWEYISRRIPMEDVIKYPNEKWDRHGLSQNKNITIEVSDMYLPNATNELIRHNIPSEEYIRDNSITTYCSVDSIKRDTRSHISKHKGISMYWIRFKDKVGMCKNPKYESDIDIICIY